MTDSKVRMTRGGNVVHRQVEHVMAKIGADISLARRVRRMATDDFAKRIGVSRATLHRLEAGDPGISMNTFIMALHALGRLDALAAIVDPARDHVTLTQMMAEVPKRIAKPRATKAAAPSDDASKSGTKYKGF
ncbi:MULTISPECIES: helix-turn-helix domain-containing protein [unclassified Rhizobium]|uniref:helix-turn-helix domain-containing protein n=1 Tax=unclassified Rhizobium TaxID=2613769 RepID=UPI0007F0C11A|nr:MULTISPECIES: helix-turn-helix transcriptional regulator [unclassified Rhizobium]ANL11994.1 DNA-binding protein [Rhizobium sp. N1341]ANM42839.1 DNA-binding protein [Rhizobium sp. N741]